MKFRTRLIASFCAIIILPLFLAAVAFMIVGSYAVKAHRAAQAGLIAPGDIMHEINSVVSPTLIAALMVTILIILFITAVFLTGGMWRGFLDPVSQLNVALQKVAEGGNGFAAVMILVFLLFLEFLCNRVLHSLHAQRHLTVLHLGNHHLDLVTFTKYRARMLHLLV